MTSLAAAVPTSTTRTAGGTYTAKLTHKRPMIFTAESVTAQERKTE